MLERQALSASPRWSAVLLGASLLGGSASGVGLDLQFSGGTNAVGGGTCTMTLGSRCRFNNVVVGANGTPYQRDIVVTITKMTDAEVVDAFDNDKAVFSGTPPKAGGAQLFAPTIRPAYTKNGWVEFTFDVLPAGGSVPPVGGGTATLPGTLWVTSMDTDGDGAIFSRPIREFVEFIAPVTTTLSSNTTLTSYPAVDGGIAYLGDRWTQAEISTDDAYKATAVYRDPSSFKLVYGAERPSIVSADAYDRLTAFDFFRPDALATQSIVEGYKSVRLTTDADGSGTVTRGDTVTYSVVYVNTGNAVATGVQLSDVLPAGLALTATGAQQVYIGGTLTSTARNTGYTGTSASSALLSSGQTLNPNSTIRVDIPATVTQATAATLSNQASASMTSGGTIVAASDTLDSTTVLPPAITAAAGWFVPPSTSVAQTVQTSGQDPTLLYVSPPPGPPTLTITKTDNNQPFYRGASGTYTVTVTNTGANSIVTGSIDILDALPSGLSLRSVALASDSQIQGSLLGVSSAGTSGMVGWSFTPGAAMTQGKSAKFVLTVDVDGTAPLGTDSITNYIAVGGGSGPAVPTPGSTCTTRCGSDSTEVREASNTDLVITKTDGTASMPASGSTVYTIRVTNNGPATVTGAVLKDVAPPGTTFTGVSCSTAAYNTCTTAPTAAQLSAGFALPTLVSGRFFEITVNATTTQTSGSVSNTATVDMPNVAGLVDSNPDNNSVTDMNTLQAPVVVTPYLSSYPATCDKLDWTAAGVTGTSVGLSGTKYITSVGGLPITVALSPATGSSNNGIEGFNSGFTGASSWNEVRAVSNTLSPNDTAPGYGGAFVTRAGGILSTGNEVNTITITFSSPVTNVRLGVTDLDRGTDVDRGDWIRLTAGYNGTTFNPDTLLGGGQGGLPVKGYNTTTAEPGSASSGAPMITAVPGRGNSTMGVGSTTNSLNTLMGTATTTSGGLQGQGVAYFKGPLTTLTIVTGVKRNASGTAVAFGNIDFCGLRMEAQKAVGQPVLQSDGSHDIPYTLTFRNTTYPNGLFPDATVRDTPFQPSFATPAGLDPWADLKPQLTDTVVPQILTNTSVASAVVVGTPRVTISNRVLTRNLDDNDTNASFDGNGSPKVMLDATDGRVSAGGSFNANFTVRAKLKDTATGNQQVNNQASASGTFNTTTLTANTATVTATLTPQVQLNLNKQVDYSYVKYIGSPAAPNHTQLVYTLTVTNPSTNVASGVVLTDTLPKDLKYVGSTPAAQENGQVLTWNLRTIGAGQSVTVTVKVDVPDAQAIMAAQPQATWKNEATVKGDNTAQKTASDVTDTVYSALVKRVHNLGTTPGATVPQLSPTWATSSKGLPGEILEYCIDFYNYGSTALPDYVLTDPIPEYTKVVEGSWVINSGLMDSGNTAPYPGATVTSTGSEVRASLGTLAPGASGTMCFRVKIN